MTKPTHAHSIKYGWNGMSYARVYDAKGRQYPSVTSVIGMADKPALIMWAARMSAEYAVDNIAAIKRLNRDDAVDLIKRNWRGKRDKAADFGSMVHAYLETGEMPDERKHTHEAMMAHLEHLEAILEDDAMPDWAADDAEDPLEILEAYLEVTMPEDLVLGQHDRAIAHIEAAQAYMKKYAPKSAKQIHEVTVFNPRVGYAGTADLFIVKKSATIVADWKTGKGLYDSAAMQLVALAKATHILNEDGTTSKIQRLPVMGHAVRTTEEGYELNTVDMTKPEADVLWKAFQGLIAVWHQKTTDTAWTAEMGILK